MITTDRFSWEDREGVRNLVKGTSQYLNYFEHHMDMHFMPDGGHKMVRTAFPTDAAVAKENGRIVGYIQWCTDCYDGYERTIDFCAVDSPIPSARAADIEEALRATFADAYDW